MGVTIGNKNKSIDMGYCGFNRLKTTIADLSKKLKEHPHFFKWGMNFSHKT